VWNGFSIVCINVSKLPDISKEGLDPVVVLRLVQQQELRVWRPSAAPSSFSQIYSLPGVTYADTVHSLCLSNALRYIALSWRSAYSRMSRLANAII